MDYKMTKMFSEINQQPKVMSNLEQVNKDTLSKIKTMVKDKNIENITLVARGSSDNACLYFKYLAEIYCGIPVTLAAPSVITKYNGKLKIKNNLCIGVSQSGKAEDVMAVLKSAKENGSIILCITNDTESPMAKMSDLHLYLSAEKEQSVAATKTFTAQMYCLTLLGYYLSGDAKILEALSSIPAKVQAVIDKSSHILPIAEKLVNEKDCFVLARGLNYAAAFETSLKMQETTYIKAKGYASSDFHHGPFAMIDENSVVILLMPIGESFDDQCEMQDKCENAGAKTIIFTDSARKGSLGTIIIPSGSDIETPFYNVVSAQLLVNMLSTLRGINPDAPRGLNKVTITK